MSKKPEVAARNLNATEIARHITRPAEGVAHVSGTATRTTRHLQPPLTIYELGRRAILDEALRTSPLPVRDARGAAPIGNPIESAQDIGPLVRAAREAQNMTQQSFADLAGVGRRFVSELENGKATLEFDKVLQVARAAGIDLTARKR
jgi:HTH-type transcriptional regulator / antitoxin HipB